MQGTEGYASLAERLGGRLVSVTPLTGGVSAEAALLSLDIAGERRRVLVRTASRFTDVGDRREELRRMGRLLAILADAGLPVARPVLVDPGAEDWLVLEYLEGSTDLPDPAVAMPALARLALQVHATPVERIADLGLPVAVDPAGEAREILARLLPEIDPDSVIEEPRPRDAAPVLLHGDLWPGNVLWDGGRVVGLIDWEDCALGDPERDLATARVELTLALGEEEATEFRSVYDAGAPHTVDQHRVDLWTVCAAGGMALHVGAWGLPKEREETVRAVALEVLHETLGRLAVR